MKPARMVHDGRVLSAGAGAGGVRTPELWSAGRGHAATALLAAALSVSLAAPVVGQDVPYLTGRINDNASMLSEAEVARAEDMLEALERETGAQIVLLTVPDLGGRSIEEYALEVAETWALGREGVDDGALFVVARDDRKLRIEVGYGLEGALTDAESRRILDWIVVPRFREGAFGEGILAGLDAMAGQARGAELAAPETGPLAGDGVEGQRRTPFLVVLGLVLWLIVMAKILSASHRAGPRTWSSSGGGRGPRIVVVPGPGRGGGFGGPRHRFPGSGGSRRGGSRGGGFRGGGGRFGGGGASSGW